MSKRKEASQQRKTGGADRQQDVRCCVSLAQLRLCGSLLWLVDLLFLLLPSEVIRMGDPTTLIKTDTCAVGAAIPTVIGEEMEGEEHVCSSTTD